MNLARPDSAALQQTLYGFTGTERWYRHWSNRHLLYTDGVQYFAEAAGTYWFLDIVATELFPVHKDEPFLTVELRVSGNRADIVADDGNGHVRYRRHIALTDAPIGIWKFFLIDRVLLLPSEY